MIFQSLEFTGRRPFNNVLLHGLIRDSQGRKMSKSLGNGIDPMDVIDEYGVDALRWFLANGSAPGQDVRYSEDKLAAAWNFINKIWNASRYVLMNVDGMSLDDISIGDDMTLADQWILSRLQETIQTVTRLFDKFEFGEAGRTLYHFIWDDYCDWYIEMTKESLQGEQESKTTQSILIYVLDQFLRLFHPIMPFVTEEIWQQLAGKDESIVVATYPKVVEEYSNPEAEMAMDQLIQIIRAVRMIRNEANSPLSKPVDIFIKVNNEDNKVLLDRNQSYLERFCNPDHLQIDIDPDTPEEVMSQTLSFAQVMMPLVGLIKVEDEIKRLEEEVARLEKEVARVDKKLANQGFVSKAPQALVEEERQKGINYQNQLEEVMARIKQLQNLRD